MIRSAGRVRARSGGGQDRIEIVHINSRNINAVLADGAGGVVGGERAADAVVKNLSENIPVDFGALFDWLLKLDLELKLDPLAGLSTVVSIYTDGSNFIGAVVGSSCENTSKKITVVGEKYYFNHEEYLPAAADITINSI